MGHATNRESASGLVLHSGRSSGGEFAHTISAADIASGWCEAILRRTQQATRDGMDRMRFRDCQKQN